MIRSKTAILALVRVVLPENGNVYFAYHIEEMPEHYKQSRSRDFGRRDK